MFDDGYGLNYGCQRAVITTANDEYMSVIIENARRLRVSGYFTVISASRWEKGKVREIVNVHCG